MTDGFKVGNGLKQRDGLAPNLFNIALKCVIRLLSVQVRFTIFHISLQLMGYADDVNSMEEQKVLCLKFTKSRERELKKQAQHRCQKYSYDGTKLENKKHN
jgi:hypothetical protein